MHQPADQRDLGRVERQQAEQVDEGGRVLGREVMQPADERRVAHFDGHRQDLVEGQEDRELHQDGQAAGHRVDLLPLHQGHGLLLRLDRIVLVASLDLVHRLLELLHPGHGLGALLGQREDQQAHADGHRQDGQAEVAQMAEEELQRHEERFGQEAQNPPVHGVLEHRDAEFLLVALQGLDHLGAGEQPGGGGDLAAGIDQPRRAAEVGVVDVHALGSHRAVLAGDLLALGGDQRRQPVFVGQAQPAAGGAVAVDDDLGVGVVGVTGLGGLLGGALGGFTGLLLPRPELQQPQLGRRLVRQVGQGADGAFMDVLRLGVGLGQALALDRGVGPDGHRRGALVGHCVGDGEHELVVHRDGAGEDQLAG